MTRSTEKRSDEHLGSDAMADFESGRSDRYLSFRGCCQLSAALYQLTRRA